MRHGHNHHYHHHHHHQSVLPKGRSFTADSVTKGCSSAHRQFFHRKLRDRGCSVTIEGIGAVASRCFPHPTLSLASEQTLKDLKRSQGHQRGGEESVCTFGFYGASTSKIIGARMKSFLMIMKANEIQGWIVPKLSRHLSYG